MQIADYYAAHKIHTLLFLMPLCYVTIWLLGRIGVISKKHCMCSFCKYLKKWLQIFGISSQFFFNEILQGKHFIHMNFCMVINFI